MVSRLKEKGLVSAPLVNVVTDYGPHMAWLAPEVDAYVVAEDGLRDAFVRMGAPKEKIHTFGIPIFEAFYQEEDRASLLRGMNLSPRAAHGFDYGGQLRREKHPPRVPRHFDAGHGVPGDRHHRKE